jgi:hypothetical protein
MTTEFPAHSAGMVRLKIACAVADPAIAAKLLSEICLLFQNHDVCDVKISGSSENRPSAVGVVSTAA